MNIKYQDCQNKKDYALFYGSIGWKIFPCHYPIGSVCSCGKGECDKVGKHPIGKYAPHGFKDATSDLNIIKQWWEAVPEANIGIATGDKLLIIDEDEDNALINVPGYQTLPDTPMWRTGKGKQIAFLYPRGMHIKSVVRFLPGIDTRATGAYGLLPPSLHRNGNTYSWLTSPELALAAVPPWLLPLLPLVGDQPKPKTNKQQTKTEKGMHAMKITSLRLHSEDDLTTAQGAPEGKRNDTLCRLIGTHLGRGEDEELILPLALAWAKKCEPEYPEYDVRRSLNILAEKERKKKEASSSPQPILPEEDNELEMMPLPQPEAWAILQPEAWHGLAGEIVRTIEPQTEADPVALLTTLLVWFGNAIGRTAYFIVGARKHHCNLFATLMGQSSKAQKGEAQAWMRLLFPKDEWLSHRILSGLSSGEGLISEVRDAREGLQPIKDKGKITGYANQIIDEGITDKRLLIVENELERVLTVKKRENNTLSSILRQAWDGEDLQVMTLHNPIRATAPHISFTGHCTREEFQAIYNPTDCFNGLFNRVLWVLVRRSKLLPNPGKVHHQPLQQKLATALSTAKTITEMRRSQEAEHMWTNLYNNKFAIDHPSFFGAVVSRSAPQTLRLSMLYALLDGSEIIEAHHLAAAYALWCYCQDSAEIIFGGAQDEHPLAYQLLTYIKAQPGISRSELHEATHRKLKAQDMINALSYLRDKSLAYPKDEATKGRTKERWYPNDDGKMGCDKIGKPPEDTLLSSFADEVSKVSIEEFDCGNELAIRPDKIGNVEPVPTLLSLSSLGDNAIACANANAKDNAKDKDMISNDKDKISNDEASAKDKDREELLQMLATAKADGTDKMWIRFLEGLTMDEASLEAERKAKEITLEMFIAEAKARGWKLEKKSQTLPNGNVMWGVYVVLPPGQRLPLPWDLSEALHRHEKDLLLLIHDQPQPVPEKEEEIPDWDEMTKDEIATYLGERFPLTTKQHKG